MSNIFSKLTSLADWQLVKISGEDNHSYLQGQVTIDINKLTEQRALFGAHCDAKGKMWSNLLIFQREQDIYYIVRKSVVERQIAELKKYAVFANLTIEIVNDLNIVGIPPEAISGQPALESIISPLTVNNCVTVDNITYIKLPLPQMRFIMVTPNALPDDLQPCDDWVKLDLEAGYAIIDAPNIESLLPQACNLQHFDAISFDKGCYCGQEMVARAEYRGANNRGLYLLSGKSATLPKIGDKLEYEIDGNWRESGQVLAAVKLNQDNAIYVQVVLANGIDINTQFRVKDQPDSQLTFN